MTNFPLLKRSNPYVQAKLNREKLGVPMPRNSSVKLKFWARIIDSMVPFRPLNGRRSNVQYRQFSDEYTF